jgi:hypothetical protein
MSASPSIHPLVRDGRRRSLLTPFMAVEAVKHWDALTSQASPVKTSERTRTPPPPKTQKTQKTQKTAAAAFLTEVATVLSDSGATDVDCVTALASLLKGLVSETRSHRISGRQIFARRLVPVLSAIASTYNPRPRFTCERCRNANCRASTLAKQLAALAVLCGVVSEPSISSLCIEWGLASLLLECAVKGFIRLSECAELNAQFRRKFRGLDPKVAVHPDAGRDGNMGSDQYYRVPMLCLRALRSLCQSVFPRGAEVQLAKFNLKQTQLMRGGLLSTALAMQLSVSGPTGDPALVAKRKLQNAAYHIIKVFPDTSLQILLESCVHGAKPSRRTSLPGPPAADGAGGKRQAARRPKKQKQPPQKSTTQLPGKKQPKPSQVDDNDNPGADPRFALGEFGERIVEAAAKHLESRQKKRNKGRPLSRAPTPNIGPAVLLANSEGLLPVALKIQIEHLTTLTKEGLGLGAMLQSSASAKSIKKVLGGPKLRRNSVELSHLKSMPNLLSESGVLPHSNVDHDEHGVGALLHTDALCDETAADNYAADDALTAAQLAFADEEAAKARLRADELKARREKLCEDVTAMRVGIQDNRREIEREKERRRQEMARLREEAVARRRALERKRRAEALGREEAIARMRGDLQRMAHMKTLRIQDQKRKDIDFRKRITARLNEDERRKRQLIDHEARQLKHMLKVMEDRNAKEIADEKLRKERKKLGDEKARKYALAAAQKSRAKLNAAFVADKKWMREARLKRQAVEKKHLRQYESRSKRWWEEWDEDNQCAYWTREGGAFTYESPFEPFWIDIFEEYHELWYMFSGTGESTLEEEIEKKRQGFDQFAAEKPPGPPASAYLSDIGTDPDAPTAGLSWEPPTDPGDQPMESFMIEGAVVPSGWTPGTADALEQEHGPLEWVVIEDGIALDADYREINQWNYQGFQEMRAARELANMGGAGRRALPKAKTDFVFRVKCFSSVGFGQGAVTEVCSFADQEEEEEAEAEEVLPVLPPMPMPSRRRRKKKGPIEMYDFKF